MITTRLSRLGNDEPPRRPSAYPVPVMTLNTSEGKRGMVKNGVKILLLKLQDSRL